MLGHRTVTVLQRFQAKFLRNSGTSSIPVRESRASSLAKSYDIVIIGGGPVGLSCAYHCAAKGLGKIAVIERDKSYSSGSAVLSAGGVRQNFSVRENVLMGIYGINFLKDMSSLAVDDEVPDVQLHKNGYLFLAATDDGKRVLENNNRMQRDCGADWIDLLTPQSLSQKFPWLKTDDIRIGSLGHDNEGYFDPWALVTALKKKVTSMGVEFIDGSVVGGRLLESSPSSMSIKSVTVRPSTPPSLLPSATGTTSSGEDILARMTPSPFEVSGGLFVNSAGAWAGHLVQLLASGSQRPAAIAALPVRPRKRCIFTVHCPSRQHLVPPPSTPLVIDPSGVYFRPEGTGGRFIMGVSPDEASDPDCDPEDDSVLKSVDHRLFDDVIWPALYERVPAFEELKVVSSWAGFYDYNTLDQNAIIGYHSELRNLVLCNGFSGHGLMQSPAAGRAASELIASGSQARFETIDLSRFSFERILQKAPIFETGIV